MLWFGTCISENDLGQDSWYDFCEYFIKSPGDRKYDFRHFDKKYPGGISKLSII